MSVAQLFMPMMGGICRTVAASNPLVISTERVTVVLEPNTPLTINLTEGQDWEQCVPFLSWSRNTIVSSSRAAHAHQPTPEIIDNGGTAAVVVQHLGGQVNNLEDIYCVIEIVEFSTDIKIQRGTHAETASTQYSDYTIDTTDRDHAFILGYSRTDSFNSTYGRNSNDGIHFSSDTNLRFEFALSVATDRWGSWYVIEDTTGSHFDTTHQFCATTWNVNGHFDFTLTGGLYVDPASTMLITHSNRDVNNSYAHGEGIAVYLTNPVTLRVTRTDGASVSGQTRNYVQIIEFTSGTKTQHTGLVSVPESQFNYDITVDSVDLAKTTAMFTPHDKLPGSWDNQSSQNTAMRGVPSIYMEDATTLRIRRSYDDVTDPVEIHATVIEWDGDPGYVPAAAAGPTSITFVSSEFVYPNSVNPSCNKPTGTVEGDLMIAQANSRNSYITAIAGGWTPLWNYSVMSTGGFGGLGGAANEESHAWYRFAGASEPSSYAFTTSSTGQAVGISTWRGVGSVVGHTVNPNTVALPTYFAGVSGMAVGVHGTSFESVAHPTAPSGTTEADWVYDTGYDVGTMAVYEELTQGYVTAKSFTGDLWDNYSGTGIIILGDA